MSDVENIIMRLRNDSAPGQGVNLGILPSVIHLMQQAADELERLRDALEEIARRNNIRQGEDYQIARNALDAQTTQ